LIKKALKNVVANSTQDNQAAVAQTQTQAPSQSQITLADNNPRRKKSGIL
jgi:hypothetical protein